MSFLIGFLGFICGFALAILLLNNWLRDVPRKELLNNKRLRVKYGLLTWGLAILAGCAAVYIYRLYMFL